MISGGALALLILSTAASVDIFFSFTLRQSSRLDPRGLLASCFPDMDALLFFFFYTSTTVHTSLPAPPDLDTFPQSILFSSHAFERSRIHHNRILSSLFSLSPLSLSVTLPNPPISVSYMSPVPASILPKPLLYYKPASLQCFACRKRSATGRGQEDWTDYESI